MFSERLNILYLLSKYFEAAPRLVGGAQDLDTEAAIANLRTTWANEGEFTSNMQAARRAVAAFGGAELQKAIGNDPASIRAWAMVGKQMQEDTPPPIGGGRQGGGVEALMSSEAYNKASHPDHQRVSRQVAEHYRRQPGGNVPL